MASREEADQPQPALPETNFDSYLLSVSIDGELLALQKNRCDELRGWLDPASPHFTYSALPRIQRLLCSDPQPWVRDSLQVAQLLLSSTTNAFFIWRFYILPHLRNAAVASTAGPALSPRLLDLPEVAKLAVTRDPGLFERLSARLRDSEEIFALAVGSLPEPGSSAQYKFYKYMYYEKSGKRVVPDVFRHASARIRGTEKFARMAAGKRPRGGVVRFIPAAPAPAPAPSEAPSGTGSSFGFRDSIAFARFVLALDHREFRHFGEELRDSDELAELAFGVMQTNFDVEGRGSVLSKSRFRNFRYCSLRLRDSQWLAFPAVAAHPPNFLFVSPRLKVNEELAQLAVHGNPYFVEHLVVCESSEKLKNSLSLALHCAQTKPHALKHFAPSIQAHPDVVRAGLKRAYGIDNEMVDAVFEKANCENNLRWFSRRLHGDFLEEARVERAISTVATSTAQGHVLPLETVKKFLRQFKNSRAFAFAVVASSPYYLNIMPPKWRDDEGLVRTCVQRDARLLRHASLRLRDCLALARVALDRGLSAAAVSEERGAVWCFASERVRALLREEAEAAARARARRGFSCVVC